MTFILKIKFIIILNFISETFSMSQQSDSQYDIYENQINNLIKKYKETRKKDTYKNLKFRLDDYQIYLDKNKASTDRYNWYAQKVKEVQSLKVQQEIQNREKQQQNKQNVQNIFALGQKIDSKFTGMNKDIAQAISTSDYIKIELNRQIQVLEDVYEENKKIQSRFKRVRAGLNTILRRAMASKLTKLLAFLTVLALIGMIVVYVLKNNGSLTMPSPTLQSNQSSYLDLKSINFKKNE